MTRSEANDQVAFGSPEADLRVQLEGLHCASCAGRVERAVRVLPGVVRADVNLANATLEVAPASVDAAALVGAVAQAGYKVVSGEQELTLEGLHCASCVGRVERALRGTPGVAEAEVNLATARARVVVLGGGRRPRRSGWRAPATRRLHWCRTRRRQRAPTGSGTKPRRLGRDAVVAAGTQPAYRLG